jgi:hypothetical protein
MDDVVHDDVEMQILQMGVLGLWCCCFVMSQDDVGFVVVVAAGCHNDIINCNYDTVQ